MSCPRCGSERVQQKIIQYADGPMPVTLCLECAYLDLLRQPTYISPKVTARVDATTRRLPDGEALPIDSQAGSIEEHSGAVEPPTLFADHE